MPLRRLLLSGATATVLLVLAMSLAGRAQDPPEALPREGLPPPPPIPQVALGPELKTVAVPRTHPGRNFVVVDPSPSVKDPEGIWILDFAFKPLRIVQVEIPGKGRRPVHYMYYRVINKTGKPRMFVPQFSLVTDTGKRYEDTVLPAAVASIHSREDPTLPSEFVRGAVDIVGILPPSGEREGLDDAIYGVAVWEGVDPAADALSVYVRGLSSGYQVLQPPGESEAPQVRYKTLRIDFTRLGDDRRIHEREIRLKDPAYEWLYW